MSVTVDVGPLTSARPLAAADSGVRHETGPPFLTWRRMLNSQKPPANMSPENHGAEGTQGSPSPRSRAAGQQQNRRRWVRGGGLAAVVVVASIVGVTALNGATTPGGTVAGPSASAGATPSASPETSTARVYPPFDRPTYAQIPGLPAASQAVVATTVDVRGEGAGAEMPEGMMGISFEADVMTDTRFEPGSSTLVDQLRKLHKPVIRFGGQAVDRRFFWTSTDEPLPAWKLVPAFAGDTRTVVKVTPADLQRLNRMAVAADAQILLTTDLGHFDPERAADMAKYAQEIFGSRLLGITVGNEPNGYHFEGRPYQILRPADWDSDKFVTEFKAYSDAMAKKAPGGKIVGPGVFNITWLRGFADLKDPNVRALSYHHYPMSDCGAQAEDSPTIDRIMSREAVEHNRSFIEKMAEVAKGAGLPLWATEGGISGCSGSNETTRTQASALWTVVYALTAAQAGVGQLDLHGALDACKGGPPASPLCDSGAYRKPNGVIVGQANYFGMMLVSALEPGSFRKVDQSGSENIYSYAVSHQDGSMSLVIVNQNDPKVSGQAPIKIKLPQAAATATMSQMTAPTFDSVALTRIDGREDAGVPASERAKVPGFIEGASTLELPLTSGTATVLNFSF
jgi:hypothetical protein